VKAATCSTVLAYDRVRAIPLDATQRDVDRLDDAVPAHPTDPRRIERHQRLMM